MSADSGALIGAAASAGSSIFGNVLSAVSNANANKKSQQFAKDMYAQQRKDALADVAAQNEYNSPRSVMQRYRDAGLNENLIYGNGTNAESAAPRASSPGSYSPQANKWDLSGVGNSIASYYSIKSQQADLDRTAKMLGIMDEQKKLLSAQTVKTLSEADLKNFDFNMKKEMSDAIANTIAANSGIASARNTILGVQRDIALDTKGAQISKIISEAAQAKSNINLTEKQIEKLSTDIDNAVKDGRLKDVQILLSNNGINQGDPWYMRIMGTILGSAGMNLSNTGKFLDAVKQDTKKRIKNNGY